MCPNFLFEGHVCINRHARACVRACVCMYVCMYVCMHACLRVFMRTYAHASTYARMPTLAQYAMASLYDLAKGETKGPGGGGREV